MVSFQICFHRCFDIGQLLENRQMATTWNANEAQTMAGGFEVVCTPVQTLHKHRASLHWIEFTLELQSGSQNQVALLVIQLVRGGAAFTEQTYHPPVLQKKAKWHHVLQWTFWFGHFNQIQESHTGLSVCLQNALSEQSWPGVPVHFHPLEKCRSMNALLLKPKDDDQTEQPLQLKFTVNGDRNVRSQFC